MFNSDVEPITGKGMYGYNPRCGHVLRNIKGFYIVFDDEMGARMFVVNYPEWRYIADYTDWNNMVVSQYIPLAAYKLSPNIEYDHDYAVKVSEIDK